MQGLLEVEVKAEEVGQVVWRLKLERGAFHEIVLAPLTVSSAQRAGVSHDTAGYTVAVGSLVIDRLHLDEFGSQEAFSDARKIRNTLRLAFWAFPYIHQLHVFVM